MVINMRTKKEINTEIAQRLFYWRVNHKFTQQDMADKLRMSCNYYGLIERGDKPISVEKILIAYNELKIDPTYLLTGRKRKTFEVKEIVENCPEEKQEYFEGIIESLKNLADM